MDSIGCALPILPGKTAAARAFQQELAGPRHRAYIARERAIGITKELWFLQETPNGHLFVTYMESPDFGRALGQFADSRELVDVCFKEQLADVIGVDLIDPPPGPLSELVSHYEAT